MKTCRICREKKPEERFAFYTTRTGNVFRHSRCKDCRNRSLREARKKTCKECGVLFSGQNQDLCPTHYSIFRYAYSLHANAVYRSKKLGRKCDLTVDWIYDRLKSPCPRTGVTFVFFDKARGFKGRSPYTASLDKIDPNKGYTKNNVQVVCWWYNCSKQQFTDQEVTNLCKLVTQKATASEKSRVLPVAHATT